MRCLLVILSLLLLTPGCPLLGEDHQVDVSVKVEPGDFSMEENREVSVQVKVENVARNTLTTSVDAGGTQGLNMTEPQRTNFTLKPEEIRIIDFKGQVEEDALPGRYVVDVIVKTDRNDVVTEKAKIMVKK